MRLKNSLRGMLLAAITTTAQSVWAVDAGWYLRAHTGISLVDDTNGSSSGVGSANGPVSVDLDNGFLAGMAVGYRYNVNWAAEIAWEYRSNDSETTLADGTVFTDGNYASNAFYVNGLYHMPVTETWEVYVGAGLGWLQEVDIDLEAGGEELSYSGDGNVGAQVFVGMNYLVNERWAVNTELRYADFGEVDVKGEEGAAGKIDGLDYAPFSLQLGLAYRF